MQNLQELTLELTDYCPSECLHCSSSSCLTCFNYLRDETALHLVNEAALLGAKLISFGGGEPTSSNIFIKVLKHVVDLNLSAEVFTCGFLNNRDALDHLPNDIMDNCKKLPKVKFIFSIHGAIDEIHDAITGKSGSLKMMLATLEMFMAAGITCEFNFVPMRINIHQLTDVIDLAKIFRIKKVSILRFVPQGRGYINRNKLELKPDEEKLFVERLKVLRRNTEVEIRTGSPFNGIIRGNKIPCRAGSGKLVIQADGNVLPCEVFKHHERCDWGLSIYDHTLSEILTSSKIVQLRKLILDRGIFSCPVHSNSRKKMQWVKM